MPDAAAAEVTSKSLRSFLVTAADSLGFSEDQKDSLGNWRDTSGKQCREPMHVRYSSQRLHSSAECKMLLLAALNHLTTHVTEPSFEKLRAVKQHLPKLTDIIQTSRQWGAAGMALPSPMADSGSDDSASVSGDSSSSETTAGEGAAVQTDAETIQWIIPSHSLIHALSADGLRRAMCTKREFKATAVQGAGATAAASAGRPWCPRCLLQLEPNVSSKLLSSSTE